MPFLPLHSFMFDKALLENSISTAELYHIHFPWPLTHHLAQTVLREGCSCQEGLTTALIQSLSMVSI